MYETTMGNGPSKPRTVYVIADSEDAAIKTALGIWTGLFADIHKSAERCVAAYREYPLPSQSWYTPFGVSQIDGEAVAFRLVRKPHGGS